MARRNIEPIPGASICVVRDGRVLLVRRAKAAARGLWSLPGGHVEAHETAEQAALRELHEETRVSARIERRLDTIEVAHHDADGHVLARYRLSVFLGSWRAGEPSACSDVSDARWASLQDIEQLDMTPGTPELLRTVLRDFTEN